MKPAVSIFWPNDKKRINKVLRTGIIPSLIFPRQLQIPGGTVALVDAKQNVLLVGTINSIVSDVKITDLEGKQGTGHHLTMDKASLRRPKKGDHKKLAARSKHLGTFYYLDESHPPQPRRTVRYSHAVVVSGCWVATAAPDLQAGMPG